MGLFLWSGTSPMEAEPVIGGSAREEAVEAKEAAAAGPSTPTAGGGAGYVQRGVGSANGTGSSSSAPKRSSFSLEEGALPFALFLP